nr:sigma 54-interacting transcriptional regulator [Saprospiraceae bacterium]
LFLDEIANLSLANQAKLLRVLQDRKVRKLGSHEEEAIDIRLITATNVAIVDQVAKQQFREDLLYRINTITLTIPPLRERAVDIPLLYQHFLDTFAKKYDKAVDTKAGTLKKLQRYHWPGNIRELRNAVERAFILCDHNQISPDDFVLAEPLNDQRLFDSYNLIEVEKMLILKAIDSHNGNLSQAAQALGLTRQSLYRRMEKYDL